MSARLRSLLVLAVGILGGVVLALSFGSSGHDTMVVLVLTLTGAALSALGGWLVIGALRGRSLTLQVLVIAISASLATGFGAAIAAGFMFLSSHDLKVLVVVLLVSTAGSIVTALALSTQIKRSLAVVAELAAATADPWLDSVSDPASAALPDLATAELRDLGSRLVEARAKLIDLRRREAALEASRRELVAWVSHDLRSPVASIRAMAEALEDGLVDTDVDVVSYHRAIRQESERLGLLVDDLFELARITAGVAPPDQPFVPVAELVGEIVESAASRARGRGVILDATFHTVPQRFVPASDVRRALDNLLDNAIRHTPKGGTVHLVVRGSDDRTAFDVIDECGGISDHDLERVFDVAFRGDAARQRDGGGGGLGLAIARGLAESRRGWIDVHNHGRGCCFTLDLPAVAR